MGIKESGNLCIMYEASGDCNLNCIFFLFCFWFSSVYKNMVQVDVEYCGKCNFEWQCKMLQSFLKERKPDTEIVCHRGREGSFEVMIDKILIHSKLQTLAFPNHESVLENIERAERGLPLLKTKEQPIDSCRIV